MTTILMLAAAMMTPWGEKVTSENCWREYPRPQMVRDNWTCLNGDWDYAVTSTTNTPGMPTKWDGLIRVPFAIESPLSGVGRKLEPNEFLWYRRTLRHEPRAGFRTLLNFECVDFRAQVFIGHREVTVLPHEGGQTPFSLDVTDFLQPGENALTVLVWDPTDAHHQATGKQSLENFGCFYTRSSGIVGSVWTEVVPETHIADYRVTTDFAAGTVSVTLQGVGNLTDAKGTVEVWREGTCLAKGTVGRWGKPVTLALPEPRAAWSPDSPALYDLKLALKDGAAATTDAVTGYFGFREFKVAKAADGKLRFHLNGQPIFAIGTLDQGWWPDGLLTPPSDEAMAFDIRTLKDLGFNMMRKHTKVEPRRYYHLCDKLGILVFQDMPTGGLKENGFGKKKDVRGGILRDMTMRYGLFRKEFKDILDTLANAPSVVAWIPFNEGWGQPGEWLTHATADWVKALDPTRPVSGPSGWFDYEGGRFYHKQKATTSHKPAGECEAFDTVDVHSYPNPELAEPTDRRARILGEFGGIGYAVSNHLWKADMHNWGYATDADLAASEARYLKLQQEMEPLAREGLTASIYTQTTDVEGEINGLITYDRKVIKYDPAKLREAHRRVRSAAAANLAATAE